MPAKTERRAAGGGGYETMRGYGGVGGGKGGGGGGVWQVAGRRVAGGRAAAGVWGLRGSDSHDQPYPIWAWARMCLAHGPLKFPGT